jgi:hypothetical protein
VPLPTSLTPLLSLVDSATTSKVEYVVGGTNLEGGDREAAAQMLADDAMKIACGASPALTRWRNRRDGGSAETGSRLEAIRTFVGIAFGSPDRPPAKDHVQGYVAELLWNRLVSERTTCRDGRRLIRAHSVKADPLEPGGDGLAIYEDQDAVHVFRLWEIKKHDAKGRLSGTVNRASKQLARRGPEYLAKLAGPETLGAASTLNDLYSEIVEMWFDQGPRVGVGVAVGTADHHAPGNSRPFGSLRTSFPGLTNAAQTEAIVIAIPDFAGFADRVKEIMWSGL